MNLSSNLFAFRAEYRIKMDTILLFLIFVLTLIKTAISVYGEHREYVRSVQRATRMETTRNIMQRRIRARNVENVEMDD